MAPGRSERALETRPLSHEQIEPQSRRLADPESKCQCDEPRRKDRQQSVERAPVLGTLDLGPLNTRLPKPAQERSQLLKVLRDDRIFEEPRRLGLVQDFLPGGFRRFDVGHDLCALRCVQCLQSIGSLLFGLTLRAQLQRPQATAGQFLAAIRITGKQLGGYQSGQSIKSVLQKTQRLISVASRFAETLIVHQPTGYQHQAQMVSLFIHLGPESPQLSFSQLWSPQVGCQISDYGINVNAASSTNPGLLQEGSRTL